MFYPPPQRGEHTVYYDIQNLSIVLAVNDLDYII